MLLHRGLPCFERKLAAILSGTKNSAMMAKNRGTRVKPIIWIIVLALAPAVAAYAAGKKLPERTSLEAFVAFIDQAIGESEFAAAKPNLPLGPGFSINTRGRELEFSENALAGKTAPDVMAQLLKNYGAWCEGLKSEPITQQEFGGISVMRVAITCNALNHDNYAEAVVIADDARFQAYDYGGFAENKDKTVAVGERLTAALTAAYR